MESVRTSRALLHRREHSPCWLRRRGKRLVGRAGLARMRGYFTLAIVAHSLGRMTRPREHATRSAPNPEKGLFPMFLFLEDDTLSTTVKFEGLLSCR